MTFLVLLAAICFLAWARAVTPASDRTGVGFVTDFQRQQVGSELPYLKVATFNIQAGKNHQGERDIRRAAELLKQVDLAGVQEVYAAGWLNKLGWGWSQSQQLARIGNFAWLFSATHKRWFREHRGNTILSRLPTKDWSIQMLPGQSRKAPRNMTIAKMRWREYDFVFINTHLHTGAGREQQLNTVLREFKQHSRVILTGDFNTPRDSAIMSEFLNASGTRDAIANALTENDDARRIDWILVRGFEVVGGYTLPVGVSDHPYYEVQLKPG